MTLAVVGALAVPTAAPAQAPTTHRLTLDAVQTTVVTDQGGHHVDGHGGAGSTEFGTSGTVWPDLDLNFGFVNHTADVSVAAQESAVAAALATWASVAPFTFTLVARLRPGFQRRRLHDSRHPGQLRIRRPRCRTRR